MQPQNIFTILVLCTGNSARSILAEALINTLGEGRFRAYSAGSKPVGQPNPFAIAHLKSMNIDTTFARSKSWQEFTHADSPSIDLVITVCDSAASEVCPIFPGQALMVHWGLPDPAGLTDDAMSRKAFSQTYEALTHRIKAMLDVDMSSLNSNELALALNKIGTISDGI